MAPIFSYIVVSDIMHASMQENLVDPKRTYRNGIRPGEIRYTDSTPQQSCPPSTILCYREWVRVTLVHCALKPRYLSVLTVSYSYSDFN